MGNRSRAVDCGGVGLYLSDRLPFLWLYIAKNVLAVDPTRMTPAVAITTGWTMCRRTRKCCSVTICGHCRSRSAGGAGTGGANGHLPGMIWLLAGVVLAGAVQDSWCCLFLRAVTVARWVSWSKRDGANRRGDCAGGLLYDHGLILAVLAMIVVKALTHSPWGHIPLRSPFRWRCLWGSTCAIASGAYWRSVGHRSGIPDFRLISGGWVAESPTWAPYFDFTACS